METSTKWFIVIVAVVLVVILSFTSCSIIQAGHVGVVTQFGAVTGKVMEEGLHLRTPFVQGVQVMDLRTQKFSVEKLGAASKDLQTVTANVTVNYTIDGTKVVQLYQTIGKKFENTIISPAVSESLKATISQYTAEQLITKRAEVSLNIEKALQAKLLKRFILIESVSIVNLDFSEAFNKAIEDKQVAEQSALKANYDLQKTKVEAQQQIEKVRGEADARVVAAEADARAKLMTAEAEAKANNLITASITPQIIDYIKAKAWDGQVSKVTGAGSGVIVDIGQIAP